MLLKRSNENRDKYAIYQLVRYDIKRGLLNPMRALVPHSGSSIYE